MTRDASHDHSECIVATTEAPEIVDGTELVRLGGIPDGWGAAEGDALQVTIADGRMATFLAEGPPHIDVFSWGYDTSRSGVARLVPISNTILRVVVLDGIPTA